MIWLAAITTFLIVVVLLLLVIGWIWQIRLGKFEYEQLQRDYNRASRERDDLKIKLSHAEAKLKNRKFFVNYTYETEINRLNDELTRKDILLSQKWSNCKSELHERIKENETDTNTV